MITPRGERRYRDRWSPVVLGWPHFPSLNIRRHYRINLPLVSNSESGALRD